jgi:membrane protease YdiL (CAAX protease family)
VVGVCAIVAAYVVFQKTIADRWYFVVPAVLIGALYLLVSIRRSERTWQDFGITKRNLRPAVQWCLGIVVSTLVLGVVATASSGRSIPFSFWLLLAAYPIWGIAQQFLFQAVLHENLLRLGMPAVITVPVTTVLFVLVHYPSVKLMYYTAVGGFVFTLLYWRYRNLLPLGVAHGLCAAIVYHLVLQRDPLARFFGP